MPEDFLKLLADHPAMSKRRSDSEERLSQARELVLSAPFFKDPGLTVFLAGSIGRMDVGGRSDFDPFIVSIKDFGDDGEKELVNMLDIVNERLGYEPFSNRRYIKVYRLPELLTHTGSPQDDSENSLTARMLLLLESTYLANQDAYRTVRDQILSQYFRDERGKESFRPLFLLNDVLRYWRTLCLNYEDLRHDPDRPWWKKNANLKFSRMVTVFSTVAALTTADLRGKTEFEPICGLTPLERLATALNALGDQNLAEQFSQFLDDYEAFLGWKETEHPPGPLGEKDFKASITASADRFSDFLYEVVTHEKIPRTRRKYLVI
jgi:hypothetical protein